MSKLNISAFPVLDVLDVRLEGEKFKGVTGSAKFRQPALEWFKSIFTVIFDMQNSGTSAQRPTIDLYEGKPYWDVTLTKRVYWTDAFGWVDSQGVPA